MARSAEPPGGGRRIEFERGRAARGPELRERLPVAPPAYLEGAWENPSLGPEEIRLLLRNRSAPAVLFSRIANDRRFATVREIRLALVVHPRAPRSLAHSLAAHLRWKELCDVADDVRVSPPVRHRAEDLLRLRLEEMAVGERVALARRATRPVIATLRGDSEGRVLEALLENPKLLESEAASLSLSGAVPRGTLTALAEHPKWGQRRAVRLALARNPRTPVRSALRALSGLSRSDLARLAGDEGTPRIVQVVAARALGPRAAEESGREG